jgi:hypothetical protein
MSRHNSNYLTQFSWGEIKKSNYFREKPQDMWKSSPNLMVTCMVDQPPPTKKQEQDFVVGGLDF